MTSRSNSFCAFCVISAAGSLTSCAMGTGADGPLGNDSGPGAGGSSMVVSTGGTPGGGGVPVTGGGGTPVQGGGGAQVTGSGGVPANGSGGTQAQGGTPAGSGGTVSTGPVTIAPANLIDDLEDGDGSIKALGGRVGAWYTYNDMTAAGTEKPIAGDPFLPLGVGNGSSKSAEASGSGFTVWGAGFGFDLNNSGTAKQTYDVSAFTGIVFGTKGTPFRFKVLTTATVPTAEGGACATTKCGDNFGSAIAATSSWQQFAVPFASLKQEGYGDVATFVPSTVIGVQFQVAKGVTFDISIDDIGFY